MEKCEVNPQCLYRDSLTLKVFNSKFDKPAELNQIMLVRLIRICEVERRRKQTVTKTEAFILINESKGL